MVSARSSFHWVAVSQGLGPSARISPRGAGHSCGLAWASSQSVSRLHGSPELHVDVPGSQVEALDDLEVTECHFCRSSEPTQIRGEETQVSQWEQCQGPTEQSLRDGRLWETPFGSVGTHING